VKKSIYRKEYKYFIEVLVEFRNKAGLLQTDLAEKLNVHQSYISKIETGQRRVDIIELREICSYLNTNLVEFTKQIEKKIRTSKVTY
jgi:transcriptional regulator with XRE-family HTH domain